MALLGCGGNQVAQPPDGGETVSRCTGPTVCDGLSLRACNYGVPGEQIRDCTADGACANGRCMSPACVVAEKDRTSFAGCLFYTAEVDNVASDAALGTSFLVTNPGQQPAVAVLQRLGVGGVWVPRAEAAIPPGKSARLARPAEMLIDEAGVRVAGALRVWSNQPVTVEQIQSDDSDESALSSGGTMLLPVHVLGLRYRVMTYPQVDTSELAATARSAGGAGRLLVVGTEAGTTVTFRRSMYATSVVTGLPTSLALDGADVFPLGEGDVFQAWTANDKDDLSGSEIESTHPVAVFSGNISTTYGRTSNGVHSPDMVHEQMPPLTAWSMKYVAAALPPQAGVCETLLGPEGAPPGASIWRLLADDFTRVEFSGPEGAPAVHGTAMMTPGEVIELVATTDFVVSASKPVLLTQGIDCEPTLSLAIPVDKLLTDVTFAVLPIFDHELAITRQQSELIPYLAQAEPVLLDGDPIDDALFVPAGGGYEVARIHLEPPCPASLGVCTHRLQGHFGVTLRGMDVVTSYATTLPAWTGCSDAPDPNCVP